MRLGTIVGGKAWAEINEAAREKREAEKKRRREAYEFKKRRRELDADGFRSLSGPWDSNDGCSAGANR